MFTKPIVHNASGGVALLFRKIINSNKLYNLLTNLIDTYADINSKDSDDKSKIKTNYTTHKDNGKMTIKIFNSIFINIFKAKEITFTIDIKYKDKLISASHEVDLDISDAKEDITVSSLMKILLENGLNEDLVESLDNYTKSISSTELEKNKKKWNLLQQINSDNLSFKIMVNNLKLIFNVEVITLSAIVKIGKSNFGDSVTINLK